MNNELQELIDQRNDIEDKIINILSDLPNWSGECVCRGENGEKGTIDIIHYGEYEEMIRYCIHCGGVI